MASPRTTWHRTWHSLHFRPWSSFPWRQRRTFVKQALATGMMLDAPMFVQTYLQGLYQAFCAEENESECPGLCHAFACMPFSSVHAVQGWRETRLPAVCVCAIFYPAAPVAGPSTWSAASHSCVQSQGAARPGCRHYVMCPTSKPLKRCALCPA